jgi:hypothetical protein
MRYLYAFFVVALAAGCYSDRYDYYSHDHGPAPHAGDSVPGFSISWKLVDAHAPGDPTLLPALSCATVGVTTIRLDAVNQDTKERFEWKFDCADGEDSTPQITAGNYAITTDALDASGTSKSRTTWTVNNFDPYGIDLGEVIFLVNL